MKPATLRALRASITHWEENAAAEALDDVHISAAKCALCARFFHASDAYECVRHTAKTEEKCPVFMRTGKTLCEITPYVEAYVTYFKCDLEAFREAAKAEVEFLKSLLPKEVK